MVIAVSTIAFASLEKITKEEWILFDSFKRAQKIYMKIVDEMDVPAFIADPSGKLLYMNKQGEIVYEEAKKSTMEKSEERVTSNFLELIHPLYAKQVGDSIKKAGKEAVDPMEVVFITRTQQKIKSAKSEGDNEESLMEQGYEYFNLRFKRAIWKASNCAIITCEKVMKTKIIYNQHLLNEILIRNQLKDFIRKIPQ